MTIGPIRSGPLCFIFGPGDASHVRAVRLNTDSAAQWDAHVEELFPPKAST